MGKGYNPYMCKKFFHPSSRENLKRVWIAEQKTEQERKKQDDLRRQYEKEQELYQNKAMLSTESKEKIELNFMYEPPPGIKKNNGLNKDENEESKEPQYKFEWQRKWGAAPRESWAKNDDEVRDQPFGIAVRHVKCVKCGRHGHINTDKECPMYGKAMDFDKPKNSDEASDKARQLLDEMKADGMALRFNAWDVRNDAYKLVEESKSREKESKPKDPMEMLNKMSKEEKRKLLKKLVKMEGHKERKEKKKRSRRHSSSESSSEDEKEERRRKHHKKDKKKHRHHHHRRH